jgi:UDP-glucose 4-epimerase
MAEASSSPTKQSPTSLPPERSEPSACAPSTWPESSPDTPTGTQPGSYPNSSPSNSAGRPELVVNGDGSAVRDFVHVADRARAFALALCACQAGTWRAYNVGSGHPSTVHDVITTTEIVTGRPVPRRHIAAAREPPTLLADSTRIRSELGWRPHRSTLHEIIADAWSALTSQ